MKKGYTRQDLAME